MVNNSGAEPKLFLKLLQLEGVVGVLTKSVSLLTFFTVAFGCGVGGSHFFKICKDMTN